MSKPMTRRAWLIVLAASGVCGTICQLAGVVNFLTQLFAIAR